MCTTRPTRPISANRTKRTGSRPPVAWWATRPRKSRPTRGVSFDSPAVAFAKSVGNLDDAQLPARRQDHVDQDLEAVRRQSRRQPRDDVAPDHEKAAHRVGDARAGDPVEEPPAEVAELLPRRRQAALRPVAHPRADREIAGAGFELAVHLRQDRLVVLQVAVDHRDIIGARGHPALDHRAGKAVAVDAPETAHARVGRGETEGDVRGSVGRIVVDDDHLPRQAVERRLDPFEQHRERWPIRGRSERPPTGSAATWPVLRLESKAIASRAGDTLLAGRARIREGKPARQAVTAERARGRPPVRRSA